MVAFRIINSNIIQRRDMKRQGIVIGQLGKKGTIKEAAIRQSVEIENISEFKKLAKLNITDDTGHTSAPSYQPETTLTFVKYVNENIQHRFDGMTLDKTQHSSILAAPGQQILEFDFRFGLPVSFQEEQEEDKSVIIAGQIDDTTTFNTRFT